MSIRDSFHNKFASLRKDFIKVIVIQNFWRIILYTILTILIVIEQWTVNKRFAIACITSEYVYLSRK